LSTDAQGVQAVGFIDMAKRMTGDATADMPNLREAVDKVI